MKTNISIALCTFNGAAFIQAQLDSIAAQTRPPGELIVCDDGSSDGTVEAVEGFAAQARFPVRLHRNATRLGSNRNFAQAIALCDGDLIFLADQDDVWAAAKIETVAERFESSAQLGCIFTNARRIDEAGEELPRSLWQHINFSPRLQDRVHRGGAFDVLAADNYATGATMAFRAPWRGAILPIPAAGIVHDDWIALVLSALSRVDCDERRLVDYRQHQGQQIGSGEAAAGMRRWISSASATGPADYAARAVRLELALERLRMAGAPTLVLSDLEQRVSHLRARASLPSTRLARIGTVAGELPRYFKYSNHLWSIAKDLFR